MGGKLRIIVLVLLVFGVCRRGAAQTDAAVPPVESPSFSLYYIPGDKADSLADFESSNTPPVIESVEFEPMAPKAGEAVSVRVRASAVSEQTNNEPIGGGIRFSTDDGMTWNDSDLEQDAGDPALWSGEIPGLPAGTGVVFIVWIQDSGGNMAAEAPPVPDTWDKKTEIEFPILVTDKKENPTMVPTDLDLVGGGFAFDGKNAIFRLDVDGSISNGNMVGFRINIYSVGIYHPGMRPREMGQAHFALVYSDLAPYIGFSKVSLLDATRKLIEIKEARPEILFQGGRLFLSFALDSIPPLRNQSLKFILGAAQGVEARPLTVRPMDVAGFVTAYFRAHEYQVGE